MGELLGNGVLVGWACNRAALSVRLGVLIVEADLPPVPGVLDLEHNGLKEGVCHEFERDEDSVYFPLLTSGKSLEIFLIIRYVH